MAARNTGRVGLESLAIVRAQVYRLHASGEITPSYTEAARAVIRTRLAEAGARLAMDAQPDVSVTARLRS